MIARAFAWWLSLPEPVAFLLLCGIALFCGIRFVEITLERW